MFAVPHVSIGKNSSYAPSNRHLADPVFGRLIELETVNGTGTGLCNVESSLMGQHKCGDECDPGATMRRDR